MLSRLSGLANTVLQELSGDDTDAVIESSTTVQVLEPGTEIMEETPEDVLERLAQTEKLVVQLKDLVREKDSLLQQKETVLKEEREAADAKLLKLKLQAKAKLASLNKRIEELTEKGSSLPVQALSGEQICPQCQNNQNTGEGLGEETVTLKEQLREQEETIKELKEQLTLAKENLDDVEIKYATQLSSLQEVIQEKEALLEEQIHHQSELLKTVAQSDLEVEMKQNLCALQRKIEEQEAALLGRTQVVQLLQQELHDAEQQKQAFLERCQKMEVELNSLKDMLNAEREEFQNLKEKMELEVAESSRKLTSHCLQEEEVQELSRELEQARRVQAELEVKYRDLEQKWRLEVEEKNLQISCLQVAEQELQSSHAALVAENDQLKRDVDRLLVLSVENCATIQKLQDELMQKSEEFVCGQNELKSQPVVQVPELKKQDETTLQDKMIDQKDEIETSLLPTETLERQKSEEILRSQLFLLEPQQETVIVVENSKQQTQNAGSEVKLQDFQTLDNSASSLDCLSASRGMSREPVNSEAPKSFDDTLLPKAIDGFRSKQFDEEDGPSEFVGHLAAQKHKELSVLLLELHEAQEEIAFLKRQLKGPESQIPAVLQTREKTNQLKDESQTLFLEKEEQKSSDIQSELDNSSLVTEREIHQNPVLLDNRTSLQEVPQGSTVTCRREMEMMQEFSATDPEPGSSQSEEVIRLQNQIMELQILLQKSQESYKKDLGEKVAKINWLNHLAEEYRKKIEDSDSAFCVLAEERDQLLCQMKALPTITELKDQVKQLEEKLALSEKQRLSDSQISLLREQIQSLKNEFKSKEIKIEALQKDLDEAQLGLSEQDIQLKVMRNQIQKKECEVLDLEQQLMKNTAEREELSQSLTSKGLQAASLEQLVAENKRYIESLQQTLLEKDQQMTEISDCMSEKMVLLNEENFSLGNELKSLKEQMSLLKAKEEKDQNIGEAKDTHLKRGESEQQYETQVACEEREVLGGELELLKKENEQVKRKLQAALINRKELLKKVSKLENELAQLTREPELEASVAQEHEREENAAGRISEEVNPESEPREAYLIQVPSEKESELQSIQRDLLDKEANEAQLQAVTEEMRQRLQAKRSVTDTMKVEIVENWIVADKLAKTSKSLKDHEENEKNCLAATNYEENQEAALKEKISTLEQEKEQLQKKLQEALTSRKDTIKKAQEKDRHHREQLKQQKDDYNILQEEFDKQSKEKESIQAQLRQLQEQRDSTESIPWGSQNCLDSSCSKAENSTNGKFVQVVDVSGEELKIKFEKLQTKKEELEYRVSYMESELACKSELVSHSQEQVAQLLLEVDELKRTCDQAQAKAASLQIELDKSQAEVSIKGSLEDLMHQKDEEVKSLKLQLSEKSEALITMQAQLLEKEDSVKTLCSQLETQAQVHEEQSKQMQTELLDVQQKQDDGAEETKQKNQMQRKLQAALISRKEALKESKSLKEELASAKTTIENLSVKLTNMESQICSYAKETDNLTEKLVDLREEREKLISEVDKALTENQNLDGCYKNLKLTLEAVAQEKEQLEKEMESLKCSQAAESSEWNEKYIELQKEYETLLQSYENVSNEAERIQRVLETVRQEKQEIFIKLKSAEAKKEETDKQLQEAEQEMNGMKEKMRKFAKSKQQKILELEEENEKLRAEMNFTDGDLHRTGDVAFLTNASLKEALESSRRDYQSLSTQFETVMAEKESLTLEIKDLKDHLQFTESKLKESRQMADKYVVQNTAEEEKNQAIATATPVGGNENQVDLSVGLESHTADLEQKSLQDSSPPENLDPYEQETPHLTKRITELEKNRRTSEQLSNIHISVEALADEKRALETQMEVKIHELNALQDTVVKMEQTLEKNKEELIRMTEQKNALEAEKDDLEERLMNQLAELNGSIGNYQQEAADFRTKNEQLKHELQCLQRMMHELEEEKCHMAKEQSKTISEKQKESIEKLKCAWKGNSSTHVKELQELLKQKQQEIKQLQKDCIKSQEKISSLERTVKALEFVQSESQKELEAAKENLAKAVEDTKKAQAELALSKVVLDDTQSEAARVLAESIKMKEELHANKESIKIQMKKKDNDFERRLEQEKNKHSKEIKNMEEKLATSQKEKDYLEKTLRDVQDSLQTKDQEAKQLEGSLTKTLAQLAAFTKSMSSLQDDRDRVIDESKTWEKKFTETIQKKEEEIHLKEETCSVLKDQMRQMTMHVEELQIHISRLERNKEDRESDSRRELQHYQNTCEMLQEEKKELLTQLEESQKLYKESQNEQKKLESEIGTLRDQLADLQNSFTKCKLAREELENMVKQQETSIQNFKFSCEQLTTDLQASKDLKNKLHEEISTKDQKIISLLSVKEEEVMAATSELQQQHSEVVKELEQRLSKEEEDKKALENEKKKILDKLGHVTEKMKISREECKQQKAQLDSFTKSMSSLQDDRDRVLRDYKQLEERHLVIILEKDHLIQEAASENNKLKEEIRNFHSRMDDLHSENAKLDAELVRYREDLNQVISIKDSQQKQLLKTQLQRIQTLEKEKAVVEAQLKESERTQDNLRKCMEVLKEDKASISQKVETLTSSLSQIQNEMTALREGGPVMECQAQLKDREEEAKELSHKLVLSQKRITELEGELVCVQKDASRKVQEAEDRLRKELKHLHHDAGILRNETETAEVRVAELAQDLMEMEQKFLTVTEENKDLKAQIHSFGKSMSSLQDSWDHANEELQVLKQKHSADLEEHQNLVQNLQKQIVQLQEEQNSAARDRDAVRFELTELQKAADEQGLLAKVEKLNQELRAKDDELLYLSSELESSSNQVKSFSKAMVSLQDERDRLLDELDKTRRTEELKQQASGSTFTTPSEVQSLKKALSSLQNDRDRLVRELKNLQQQYIQVGVETAENSRLKAQLQEYQQEADKQRHLHEQLKCESVFYQQELQQLRQEKTALEKQNSSIKEQYLMVIADKDQQLNHFQKIMQEMGLPLSKSPIVEKQYQKKIFPEVLRGDFSSVEAETKLLQAQLSDTLKELHQKELRIQQLNSKLSQVFEEKNALSLQLRGSSRNISENHQHYSEVLNRCLVLERQLQEIQQPPDKGTKLFARDAAPGAPQEKSEPQREGYAPELQELQLRLSETEHLHSSTKQDLRYLEDQLEEEHERRLAAEEALSAAQDQIRRLESSEWMSSLSTSIDMAPGQERSLLIDSMDNTLNRTRHIPGLWRLLRSLFRSRTHLPLLVAMYLLVLHVLLFLCFTGHL